MNVDDTADIAPMSAPQWDVIDSGTREVDYTATLESGKTQLGRDEGDLTAQPDTVPHLAPLDLHVAAQVEAPAPKPATNGKPKIASIKFNAQTVDEWKQAAMAFIVANPNWSMKNGLPDMGHIQASSGHCGYATIDGDNRDEVFNMIKSAHESKQADEVKE
jgi:hypothetical protein